MIELILFHCKPQFSKQCNKPSSQTDSFTNRTRRKGTKSKYLRDSTSPKCPKMKHLTLKETALAPVIQSSHHITLHKRLRDTHYICRVFKLLPPAFQTRHFHKEQGAGVRRQSKNREAERRRTGRQRDVFESGKLASQAQASYSTLARK